MQPTILQRAISCAGVSALVTTALVNSLRVLAGALSKALLDAIYARHFGKVIGAVLGRLLPGCVTVGPLERRAK